MKYTYNIIVALLLLLVASSGKGQSMTDVLLNMPGQIIPLVTYEERLRLVDLYHSGQKAQIPQVSNDTLKLCALGNSYIHIRTSAAATVQIKRVGKDKKTIYAVIYTTEGPVAHSHIELYNSQWEMIPKPQKFFTAVTLKDFIIAQDKSEWIYRKVITPTIQYTMSEASNDIIATPTFVQTVDIESQKELTQYIHSDITIRWNGKKWVNK